MCGPEEMERGARFTCVAMHGAEIESSRLIENLIELNESKKRFIQEHEEFAEALKRTRMM